MKNAPNIMKKAPNITKEALNIGISTEYLTIIPRARMGSESIAHEGERNNCFSKIQLVGQKKYRGKTSFAS